MMEGNNKRWEAVLADVGEAITPEWRLQLQGEARQRIVNKIMDTLKKHLPISGPEGLGELKKIAVRFEEKIYTAAISQSDYLRKISMKMLTMEQKTQGGGVNGNPLPSTSGAANQNSSDPANLMQPQVRNQGSSMQVPVTNQPQTRQQLLAQNLQSNISSTTVQGSGGLSSITGLTQPNMSSLGQNPNMHAMPVIAQNSVNNTPGQSVPQNIYANSQRQMQERHQQQSMISQQHQQQPQNQILYQQQLIKQKMQQSSLLQSQIPQQQQPVIQQNQLQSSQQPLIQLPSGLQSNQNPLQHSQPSMIQSVSQSGIQQNQQNSVQQPASSLHQQHPQSLVRQQQPSQQPNLHQQTSSLMQQPTSISQQSAVLPSHQQQIMGHQSNLSNIQQNQLLGQHNNISDLQQQQQLHQHQQHQQHQRLSNQQNGLMSLQQPQQMINQQNISLHQQQQMPPQSSVSGMQQQPSLQAQHQSQILGSTIPASNMQPQNPMHILQHSKAAGQHMQQTSPVLLQLQGQQSQAQSSQQQLMPQLQTQAHLQQQMGLQQMHRRLQAPGSLLQSQITTEQKPQFQSQRVLPEAPSTSVDSTGQTSELVPEWQEEIYQKILSMKEMYYPELHELSQKLGIKLQQQDPLPPPSGSKQVEQLENMKKFKNVLDRMVQMLLTPRNTIPLAMKDKIPIYEKQIINMITNRSRRAVPLQPQSQQQLQHSGGQNLAIPQPPSQVPTTDSQLNQISQMSFQATSTPMNSTGMSSMQSGSLPLSTQIGVPTTQQNIMSSLQSGSNIESGNALSSAQKAAMGSLHVGGLGTLQQSSIGAAHQNNVNNLMQNNANPLQRNALQHQVKQEQQQQQHQQHQHQQLVMQKRMQQQLIQQRLQQQQPQHHQQLQQQKQQPNVQLQGSQMQQLHPINEMNELKMRQISGIKPVLFQPPYQIGQRQAYYQQQHKIPTSFPISSPQSIPISSPQISQHSSPQIDQQPLLSSISKSLTPLQSVSSPAVDPSSPAPPTLPIEHEKQLSNMSSLSNTGNSGPQQSGPIPPQAQSLVVDTPGISVSSLLDGKTTVTERPLEHLLRVVGSLSPNLLASSASDIGSVVSMIDQIAGSAPGNGSRASIGEDLVAMTKCRMQARNFMSQDGGAATKKMKRHTSAMPLNVVPSAGSVHDSLKRTSIDTSELESTATSRIKRQKMEANHALLEEIRFINQQLIDTSVDVTEEDVDSISSTTEGEGAVVKFTYCAVALCPTLKLQFAAARVSPILPLRLLIPPNYPCCSPVLLDKIPVELRNESEDLSVKAKSRFSSSLRGLSSPMSLKEMARTWDVCARRVISEFAQLSGGGTFSSKYGTWENCARA